MILLGAQRCFSPENAIAVIKDEVTLTDIERPAALYDVCHAIKVFVIVSG